MEFLQQHQLNIMLFFSGICGSLMILTFLTRSLSQRRRHILSMLEFGAMMLLFSDRFAYIYRGDVSTLGFWMVRVCNFLVYFFTLFVPFCITLYLIDLYRNEGGLPAIPKRLKACRILFGVGVLMLIVSQFTGMYYTFDALNQYQRAPLNLLCFVVPVAVVLLQMSTVIQFRARLSRGINISLILNSVVPLIAGILQFFTYGLSLINMTVVGMSVLLYVFALLDLHSALEKARENEIESYREAQRKEHALFEDTAEALVNAIDTKDRYTQGHSTRVAAYARQIAQAAGKSEEECEDIYFAALLHDVGKIGVPDSIITKDGRLTEEEFAQIRLHPVYGNQILSSIHHSPHLSDGAHYHHERYDGRGYPEGLKGEETPDVARIIAVADAYDAMTSKRSYRDPIPQQKVRAELIKGTGTQFDPQYAAIMLRLIDEDVDYRMRERGAESAAGSA